MLFYRTKAMAGPGSSGIGAVTIYNRIDYGRGEKLFVVSFDGDGLYLPGGTAGANVTAELRAAIAIAAAMAPDANVRGYEAVTIKDLIPGDCGRYEPYWVNGRLKMIDGGSATRDEVFPGADLSMITVRVAFLCD